MEPKAQKKEHQPMAEDTSVVCVRVGERLPTCDDSGKLLTESGATIQERRPEDVPTIEMTRAELEEMLRTSGW